MTRSPSMISSRWVSVGAGNSASAASSALIDAGRGMGMQRRTMCASRLARIAASVKDFGPATAPPLPTDGDA